MVIRMRVESKLLGGFVVACARSHTSKSTEVSLIPLGTFDLLTQAVPGSHGAGPETCYLKGSMAGAPPQQLFSTQTVAP